MLFNPSNFLTHIKSIIAGDRVVNGGFLVDLPIPLGSMDLNTTINYDGSESGAAVATLGGAFLTADETNARVIKVEEGIDSIGHLTIAIPRDYDEALDHFQVKVLASMLSVSTDDDVELDAEAYVKTAGSALGADLGPTAPGTVLSTTEQWLTIDLSGNSLKRQDVLTVELITNGANDTNAEEVVIHAIQAEYRSTLVSYKSETAAGSSLR